MGKIQCHSLVVPRFHADKMKSFISYEEKKLKLVYIIVRPNA